LTPFQKYVRGPLCFPNQSLWKAYEGESAMKKLRTGSLLFTFWLSLTSVIYSQESEERVSEGTLHELLGGIEERTSFHGFADIQFRFEDPSEGEERSFFTLGQLDFFPTAQLTDHISFLNETIVRAATGEQQIFSVERLIIKYAIRDSFNLALGRFHTALGYWNEAYHHGAWLQTTIDRPEIMTFNAILPIHSVGVELSGILDFPTFDLSYVANFANGRGITPAQVQIFSDANNDKAYAFKLSLRPKGLPGLALGPTIYYDVIPPDISTPPKFGETTELILGGHLVYLTKRFEFLAEYFNIHHDEEISSKTFDTNGFYIQTAYQKGKLKPYYRFDFVDIGKGDPFFSSFIDIKRHTVGLRYDVATFNALKLEYAWQDTDVTSANLILFQSAFAF